MGLKDILFRRKKRNVETTSSQEENIAMDESSMGKENASAEDETSFSSDMAAGHDSYTGTEPSEENTPVGTEPSGGNAPVGTEPSEGNAFVGSEPSEENVLTGSEPSEGNASIGLEPSGGNVPVSSGTSGGNTSVESETIEGNAPVRSETSAKYAHVEAEYSEVEAYAEAESPTGNAYAGAEPPEENTPVEAESLADEAEETKLEEKASKEKKGFFARLKEGLTKTRNNIVKGIDSLFNGFSAIDDDFYEELEEILIMGDIGVNATMEIVARLKSQVKEQHIKEPRACKQLLIEGIKEQMRVDEAAYDFEKQQSVIMVIGVNGVGKTTSVGKMAGKLKEEGRKVLIAAADTFRAAAGDQLAEWARRAEVPMVGGKEGADPASVVFDAVNAAKARGVDVLLIDTAGRLHNKKNLMEELRKMNRIIDREFPNAHRENLIVLDGTTGQNALVQAREFGSVAELTGIILTKMDGTAKGGIAVAIQSELRVPVKYIGVGETIDDLQKFDSDEFVNALFDVKSEEEE